MVGARAAYRLHKFFQVVLMHVPVDFLCVRFAKLSDPLFDLSRTGFQA